jgi:hypothetical protein
MLRSILEAEQSSSSSSSIGSPTYNNHKQNSLVARREAVALHKYAFIHSFIYTTPHHALTLLDTARQDFLLLAGVGLPLLNGGVEGVSQSLCLPVVQVGGHALEAEGAGLASHWAADSAAVVQPRSLGADAAAACGGRDVSHTLTAQLGPVAGQALVVHTRAFHAQALVLDLVGEELRHASEKADLPAAALVVEHTAVEVGLADVICAGAAAVRRHDEALEATDGVVVGDERDAGAPDGARGGVVHLNRVLPDVEVLAGEIAIAVVQAQGGELSAVLELEDVLPLGLDARVLAICGLHAASTDMHIR